MANWKPLTNLKPTTTEYRYNGASAGEFYRNFNVKADFNSFSTKDADVVFGESTFANSFQTRSNQSWKSSNEDLVNSLKTEEPVDKPPTTSTVSSNPETSFSGISSGIIGMGLSSINSVIGNTMNSNLLNEAKAGTTSMGHDPFAVTEAESIASQRNTLTGIENATIGVGSAFGPIGLAVGTGLAAVEGAIGSHFISSSVSENTTSGDTVTLS